MVLDLVVKEAWLRERLELDNLEFEHIYEDLIGKPWKLGTRGPDEYDCYGLVWEVGRRVGIEYPFELSPLSTEDQSKVIREGLDKHFIRIDKPEPWCFVTFNVTKPFTDHCGIVLPDCLEMLHIMKKHHVATNRLDHRILSRLFEGYYKLRI